MKLLDTTVAVDHLRGAAEATELLVDLTSSGEDIASSELVRFELLAGVREHEMEALDHFFTALIWIPVEAEIAGVAGVLARKHRKGHSGIGDVDYLIAATSIVLDAELLTTNVRHFPMLNLTPPY